jgi:hypothetical protein
MAATTIAHVLVLCADLGKCPADIRQYKAGRRFDRAENGSGDM